MGLSCAAARLCCLCDHSSPPAPCSEALALLAQIQRQDAELHRLRKTLRRGAHDTAKARALATADPESAVALSLGHLVEGTQGQGQGGRGGAGAGGKGGGRAAGRQRLGSAATAGEAAAAPPSQSTSAAAGGGGGGGTAYRLPAALPRGYVIKDALSRLICGGRARVGQRRHARGTAYVRAAAAVACGDAAELPPETDPVVLGALAEVEAADRAAAGGDAAAAPVALE